MTALAPETHTLRTTVGRRTRIVATLGPASSSLEQIVALIAAGMDVARLGFAHGSADRHIATVRRIREAAQQCGRPVGVLVDLPGPKVRTAAFVEPVSLEAGRLVRLVTGPRQSRADVISVDYASLLQDIEPGDRITLGDGAVLLVVTDVTAAGDSGASGSATAEVIHGGELQGRPGVHLPSGKLSLSAPTAEDLQHLELCLAADVDFVAVSFVRRADDIRRARQAVVTAGGNMPMFVAKIETPVAIQNLDEIVAEADAVMVARGDLGTECPLEDVPHLQKRIVRACMASGRPVITATQMLESMTHAAAPTRAEASDVANAVLDGSDAVMLSGETAIGHDPVGAVRTMARIAERAELEADDLHWGRFLDERAGSSITEAMTHAAWRAARDAHATAILCCTWSGATVRALARFRPGGHLIALSPNERTLSRLTLSWGTASLALAHHSNADAMVAAALDATKEAGYVTAGDVVAILAGSPDEHHSATDALRLVRV